MYVHRAASGWLRTEKEGRPLRARPAVNKGQTADSTQLSIFDYSISRDTPLSRPGWLDLARAQMDGWTADWRVRVKTAADRPNAAWRPALSRILRPNLMTKAISTEKYRRERERAESRRMGMGGRALDEMRERPSMEAAREERNHELSRKDSIPSTGLRRILFGCSDHIVL